MTQSITNYLIKANTETLYAHAYIQGYCSIG